jgi:hypothetical protein
MTLFFRWLFWWSDVDAWTLRSGRLLAVAREHLLEKKRTELPIRGLTPLAGFFPRLSGFTVFIP